MAKLTIPVRQTTFTSFLRSDWQRTRRGRGGSPTSASSSPLRPPPIRSARISAQSACYFRGQDNIRETEVTTATRVAEFMFDEGLAQVKRPRDIRAWIEGQLYKPQY